MITLSAAYLVRCGVFRGRHGALGGCGIAMACGRTGATGTPDSPVPAASGQPFDIQMVADPVSTERSGRIQPLTRLLPRTQHKTGTYCERELTYNTPVNPGYSHKFER